MFFVLKILSNNILYKYLFFVIIKYVHINKIDFLLKQFYPVLKFKIKKFPIYYFTNISKLSKKLVFNQLINAKKRNQNHKSRKFNNIYYYNKFNKINLSQIKTIKIYDFNYQNFIDFPILVKNRIALNKFLLINGIESRLYYYKNCEQFFNKNKKISLRQFTKI